MSVQDMADLNYEQEYRERECRDQEAEEMEQAARVRIPDPIYTNPELCAECGGECCKKMSGNLWPCDFKSGDLQEQIIALLESGRYTVDYWEGPLNRLPARGVYLRPKVDTDRNRYWNATWGGTCVFLKDYGCELLARSRPFGCRMVEPITLERCDIHNMRGIHVKKATVLAWWPYHKEIAGALDQLGYPHDILNCYDEDYWIEQREWDTERDALEAADKLNVPF